MRRPDFFVVGAPKCGTTAMDSYLKQHPDLYLPERKEPQFFGSDLRSRAFLRDKNKYLSLFSGAKEEQRVGETSVWSLYSQRAAVEIRDFNPRASVIIMLRDPVEMLHALHSQYLYTGNEDILDFGEALEAEEHRKKGLRVPKRASFVEGLFYTETAKFSQQVKRYLDVFGKERVHVVIFDDFKSDVSGVYGGTLRFLGVDPDFRPEFGIINPNKRVRNETVRDLTKHPPLAVRRTVEALVPRRLLYGLIGIVDRYNTRYSPRDPIAPKLQRSLRSTFASEVEQLSDLIGRDLTHWTRSASHSAS